ncbi:hypothetical protein GQ457_17G009510 [Hibiscus cannabinus]
MAINNGGIGNGNINNILQESSPLLSEQVGVQEDEKKKLNVNKSKDATAEVEPGTGAGWTADGLPLVHGSVVGEPMGRSQWDSSLLACLGRNDEFCSSDIEVCLLGSVAPCVLYGSNVERVKSAPGTFANHCLPYSGLYLIGNSFFGWNCLAPWFSYPYPNRHSVPVRHLTGHVDVVEAVWKMRFNVNTASRPVTLQHMFSAMHVLFARKVVSFVEGCLTPGSVLSLYWS